MGCKPIGKVAMTPAERQRRRRERLKPDRRLAALCRAWEACTKRERTRFLRQLRAGQLAAQQARRAERERELADRINRENERRGVDMTPVAESSDGWGAAHCAIRACNPARDGGPGMMARRLRPRLALGCVIAQ